MFKSWFKWRRQFGWWKHQKKKGIVSAKCDCPTKHFTSASGEDGFGVKFCFGETLSCFSKDKRTQFLCFCRSLTEFHKRFIMNIKLNSACYIQIKDRIYIVRAQYVLQSKILYCVCTVCSFIKFIKSSVKWSKQYYWLLVVFLYTRHFTISLLGCNVLLVSFSAIGKLCST